MPLKTQSQNAIKPLSKSLWTRRWCLKLCFFPAGCRKPKKVGKHCSRRLNFRSYQTKLWSYASAQFR